MGEGLWTGVGGGEQKIHGGVVDESRVSKKGMARGEPAER